MNDSSSAQRKSLIFLTGFMGSGKTTIGPILANSLGFDFIDVDKFIERKAHKEVVEIFRSEGEQAFRTLERLSLRELSERKRSVIALGGGTIANEENLRLVSQKGILIYLKLSPEEILQRVQHRSDRPMLKDDNGNPLSPPELDQRIRDLLARREPFYSRADVTIAADAQRVGKTVDEIMKTIRAMIDDE